MITLFDDKELEEFTDIIYHKCAEKDCDKCEYRNSVKEDVCVIEVTMDLHRHWKSLICGLEVRPFGEVGNTPTLVTKKGKWSKGSDYYICIDCLFISHLDFNYCPNCGADMRGEKK